LVDYLSALVLDPAALSQTETSQNTLLRKLVKVPDSGFKTRIVAIVDFWTQLIMMPIRQHVQGVTRRKFKTNDFRLNQNGGVAAMVDFQNRCLREDSIGNHKLNVKHLKFYDISSWTDRFHRDLQKIVMKNLFNPRIAEAWAQLVVHCDWYSPDLKRTIKFGQGQGMGTNGSFDIATLTDHLFINYIFEEVSTTQKDYSFRIQCYGKVGDDLWIYDPDNLIPEYYGKINLPLNISKSKTYNGHNSIAEFCSRTFIDGVDVSRISPRIINRSLDFRYIPMLLALCAERGIQLDSSSFESLNRKVRNSEETYLDKLQDWLISLLVIGKYEQSSYYSTLTLDYLEAGNWLVSNRLRDFLIDHQLSARLMICHSIMKIAKSKEDIKNKIFENTFAMDEWGDEITSLCYEGVNLFNPSSEEYITTLSEVKSQSALTPKQIIILGRYVDQRRLVRDELDKIETESWSISNPEDILRFANGLEEIATKSSYDDGRLNYDSKKVITTQFEIVEILNRSNEDLTIFTLRDSNDLRTVLQELQYDRLNSKWGGILPMLDIEPPASE
jgi:hypothetical protein